MSPRTTGPTRACSHCGEEFVAVGDRRNFKQRYCSRTCNGQAQRERAVKSYPSREEVVRYEEEGLSDVDLGRRFGRSYQWAFRVRRYYGINGRSPRPPRKPLHRKQDRARWSISLKSEPVCRNCKQPSEFWLHLHHALPRSLSPATKYDLLNGIPLCTKCHLGWHHRRVTIYRDCFTEEEWSFISAVELQGQNLTTWLDDRYPDRGEPFRTPALDAREIA